jgi:hypothetical protein
MIDADGMSPSSETAMQYHGKTHMDVFLFKIIPFVLLRTFFSTVVIHQIFFLMLNDLHPPDSSKRQERKQLLYQQ